MLIDSNLVSIDGKSLASAITGEAIPLNSLLKPGRHEPVCVYIRVTEEVAGGDSIELSIQQADSKDGSYTDAAKATVAASELRPDNILAWRWLPPQVTSNWLKIKVSPTGTFTAGKIFAAIVREDPQEYEDGMYIDKGQLQW